MSVDFNWLIIGFLAGAAGSAVWTANARLSLRDAVILAGTAAWTLGMLMALFAGPVFMLVLVGVTLGVDEGLSRDLAMAIAAGALAVLTVAVPFVVRRVVD